MSRVRAQELDDISKNILRLLEEDSRTSLKDIAETVHVSPTTVRDKIKRMKEDKIIKRCSIDIDFQAVLGNKSIRAIFFVDLKKSNIEEARAELARVIKSCKCCQEHYRQYGTINSYIIMVQAISEKMYNDALVKLNSMKYVDDVREVLLSHKVYCHDVMEMLPIA